MTEGMRVRVEAVDLRGEAPVVVRDAEGSFTLGIDFSQPPETIAASLQGIFQEAVDTNRWHRRGTCQQERSSRAA